MATDWQDPRITLIERLCNINLKSDGQNPPSPTLPYEADPEDTFIWSSEDHLAWMNLLEDFGEPAGPGQGPDKTAIETTYYDPNNGNVVVSYGVTLTNTGNGSFFAQLKQIVADAHGSSSHLNLFPDGAGQGLYGGILALLNAWDSDGLKDEPIGGSQGY